MTLFCDEYEITGNILFSLSGSLSLPTKRQISKKYVRHAALGEAHGGWSKGYLQGICRPAQHGRGEVKVEDTGRNLLCLIRSILYQ